MLKVGWRGTPEKRFWEKVQRGRGCWLWTGAKSDGYGSFRVRPGISVLAHRYAYELLYGAIPRGKFVLHACDVRPCVRHLFPGTNKENMLDASEKGRLYKRRGWCVPKLKVKLLARIEKLSLNMTQKQIASLFGVHQSQISRVLAWKTFKHRMNA